MRESTREKLFAGVALAATVAVGTAVPEIALARGVFVAECHDKDGNLKWRDEFRNTVMTAGKNLALDTILGGSAYTVTGPYMLLISSVSYSSISAADTMASHAGWLEAGGTNAPTYSGNRPTAAWSSASAGAKALSSALSFTMTGPGTIKGVGLAYGSGAVVTKDNTSGTLLSGGLFSGGDRAVLTSDVVNVSWSLSL